MNRKRISQALVLTALFACGAELLAAKTKAPSARVQDLTETRFGVNFQDPYRWLEDGKAPEVQKWMAAQDQHARAYLHSRPGRERYAKRFRELLYYNSVSAPVRRGDRYFYFRKDARLEKDRYVWRPVTKGLIPGGRHGLKSLSSTMVGNEIVILDPNAWSKDGGVSLGVVVPSWDGTAVAYTKREGNGDESTLYVKDVASGRDLPGEKIEGAKYANPAWLSDNRGFYYTWVPVDPAIPTDQRPGYAEVRFHRLGSEPKEDPVVYPATHDPKSFLDVDLSRDGRWLFVKIAHGWSRDEVFVKDLHSTASGFQLFFSASDAQASTFVWKDQFYVLTTEGAPHGKILKVSGEGGVPSLKNARTIVEERKNAVLEGFELIGDRLVLTLSKDVSEFAEVRDLEGKSDREVPLPGIGTLGSVHGNPDDDEAFLRFESFAIPPRVLRFEVSKPKPTVWAQADVKANVSNLEVDQKWFKSKDGVKIPLFLVHTKKFKKDGKSPMLLYGYGGFQAALTPRLSATVIPWLEAGGAYAVVNLRGGSEFGEDWHRDGMLLKKQNVFDDFIAAAQFLIDGKYTSAERLAIRGGSNGGLLVGAALTQRPELFRAVVCEVPLLDMIRYPLFGSGRTWMSEYGNPEEESFFRALHAYSPYHHVEKKPYPSVLFHSADNDDRVDPMHARKMAALLQRDSTSGKPVLLRIEKQAGHGGADLVRQTVEKSADTMVFLMSELGMKNELKGDSK